MGQGTPPLSPREAAPETPEIEQLCQEIIEAIRSLPKSREGKPKSICVRNRKGFISVRIDEIEIYRGGELYRHREGANTTKSASEFCVDTAVSGREKSDGSDASGVSTGPVFRIRYQPSYLRAKRLSEGSTPTGQRVEEILDVDTFAGEHGVGKVNVLYKSGEEIELREGATNKDIGKIVDFLKKAVECHHANEQKRSAEIAEKARMTKADIRKALSRL